jgi:hypothetical protein
LGKEDWSGWQVSRYDHDITEDTMKTGIMMLGSLSLWACAALFSGCATIVSGTTQEMSFQTNPENVVVSLIRSVPDTNIKVDWTKKAGHVSPTPMRDETRILGKTPFTLQLDREEGQRIELSKEGYKPITMKLATTTNRAFWGNILLGGLVGSTTDGMSGAIYEYSPSQFFVTLNPEMSTTIDQGTGQPQRDKALAFIVRRYTGLMANLSQGNGEDWSALKGLLHIGQGQEPDARKKIQALAMVYPDIPVFASHVTDLYLK